MRRRNGGLVTAAVGALAVAALALLGVGGGPAPAVASGDYGSTSDAPTTTSTSTSSTSTTSTPTSSTTTTTTSSTTTTTTAAPSLLPLAVSPRLVRIGPGDVATISGTCPTSAPGPVVVWEVGAAVRSIDTGIATSGWTYAWRSPLAADVEALQVWCGDPSGWTGGYPAELQVTVEYVSQGLLTGDDDGSDAVDGDGDGGAAGPGLVLPDSR